MADKLEQIQTMIYEIRGQKVMLDFDLAVLYQVETKYLNRTVKRHLKRFPADFMFQLADKEWEILRFQIGTAKKSKNEVQSLCFYRTRYCDAFWSFKQRHCNNS